MTGFKDVSFADRRASAAIAKQAMLEKFKTRPGEDDPAEIERKAERSRIAEARTARLAEKQAAREAEEALRAAEREAAAVAAEAERIAAEQAQIAEQAARDAQKLAMVARVMEDEAARKAARDLRYANRKARSRS